IPRSTGDLGGQVQVEQKVLPKLFFRPQVVARDHIAQGRQSVDGAHFLRPAISQAMRSAAMTLAASAMPRPAISKAVPWSGDVRTKGSPSVTLTPPAKSRVLIGISA